MIPVEVVENTGRVRSFVAIASESGLCVNLDTIEEVRISGEAIKRRLERRYKTKVVPRSFQVEDLVLRKA